MINIIFDIIHQKIQKQERLKQLNQLINNKNLDIIPISACLAGINCRYDGENKKLKNIEQLSNKYLFIPFCPEILAGLSVPRASMEFINGDGKKVWLNKAKLLNSHNIDLTEHIKNGALEALYFIKNINARFVVSKEKSPSCGVKSIYQKNHILKKGMGILTYLLIKEKITVYNEHDFIIL